MPRPLRRSTLALCLLLAAGLARAEGASAGADVATTSAPVSPAQVPKVNRRAINGHEFLPSATVNAPLAVSSFGMDERLSYGSATGQRYDLSGNPTGETRTYSFGGMVTGVRFQTALGEAFTVRGGFTISLFSGTDTLSALVVGTTLQPGLQLGAEWSRAFGEQWRIGVSLDYDNSPQLNLLIMAAIRAAIDNGGLVEGEGAFQQNNVATWTPAFTAAWVPHRAIGLVGRLGYVNSAMETAASGTLTRQAIALGLAADLDLRHFWATVPMGVSLTDADSLPLGDSISGIRDVGLGLMYTGNSDLAAGVVLGAQTLRIRPQYDDPLKASTPYLTIVLRAYWP
jgi:hypothetical protein